MQPSPRSAVRPVEQPTTRCFDSIPGPRPAVGLAVRPTPAAAAFPVPKSHRGCPCRPDAFYGHPGRRAGQSPETLWAGHPVGQPARVPVGLLAALGQGQHCPADRFRQRRPGVDDAGQVGVIFRFTGQGVGQGFRGCFANLLAGWRLRNAGQGFESPHLHLRKAHRNKDLRRAFFVTPMRLFPHATFPATFHWTKPAKNGR